MKPPRVAFDRIFRVCFVHVVRAITTGACAHKRGDCVHEQGWGWREGQSGRERETGKGWIESETERQKSRETRMLRAPGWGWENERAGSTEKARPGSFKPASTTRDFAVYVLCRVDTREGIYSLSRLPQSRGGSAFPQVGTCTTDRGVVNLVVEWLLATIPRNPSITLKQSLFVVSLAFIISQCLSTIKIFFYDCQASSNLAMCYNVSLQQIFFRNTTRYYVPSLLIYFFVILFMFLNVLYLKLNKSSKRKPRFVKKNLE